MKKGKRLSLEDREALWASISLCPLAGLAVEVFVVEVRKDKTVSMTMCTKK